MDGAKRSPRRETSTGLGPERSPLRYASTADRRCGPVSPVYGAASDRRRRRSTIRPRHAHARPRGPDLRLRDEPPGRARRREVGAARRARAPRRVEQAERAGPRARSRRGRADARRSARRVSHRAAFDGALVAALREAGAESIVLAGFMRLLTPAFLAAFPHRVVNIHPSLLPAFPGVDAQAQALAYGVRVTGCTVHLVDAGTDTGPILAQAAVPVLASDTRDSLAARILHREHQLLVKSLGWIAEGRLAIDVDARGRSRAVVRGVDTAIGVVAPAPEGPARPASITTSSSSANRSARSPPPRSSRAAPSRCSSSDKARVPLFTSSINAPSGVAPSRCSPRRAPRGAA